MTTWLLHPDQTTQRHPIAHLYHQEGGYGATPYLKSHCGGMVAQMDTPMQEIQFPPDPIVDTVHLCQRCNHIKGRYEAK